jgi:glutamate 5-kinase
MASKVASARMVTRTGVPAVVAPGREPAVLTQLLDGADVGTLFVAGTDPLSSRKHWIAYGSKPTGRLVVDDGAVRAVASQGKSLLPRGITEVVGGFGLGDTVSVVSGDGREFARGLVAYQADDLRKIRGLHTGDIEATLGYKSLDEAIHRDDLVLL